MSKFLSNVTGLIAYTVLEETYVSKSMAEIQYERLMQDQKLLNQFTTEMYSKAFDFLMKNGFI